MKDLEKHRVLIAERDVTVPRGRFGRKAGRIETRPGAAERRDIRDMKKLVEKENLAKPAKVGIGVTADFISHSQL